MHTLVKIAFLLAIILQAHLITGSRFKRATIDRTKEISQLIAAAKKFLNSTATTEQLTQLKRDVTLCFKKNLTSVSNLFGNNLASFLNPFFGGRRKRDVISVQDSQPVSDKIDLGKEPQTRAEDITAIMTQVKKILNVTPNTQLVAGRKFVQSISKNGWLPRSLFLTAALGATSLCANTNFFTG